MQLPFVFVHLLTHRSMMRHQNKRGLRKFWQNNSIHIFLWALIISWTFRFWFEWAITIGMWTFCLLSLIMNPIIRFAWRGRLHKAPSPLRNQTLPIKDSVQGFGGMLFVVDDWLDRKRNRSWMDCSFRDEEVMFYVLRYGNRQKEADPDVNEVLTGQVVGVGKTTPFIFHINELELCDLSS